MRLSSAGALASISLCPCIATPIKDEPSPGLVSRQFAAPPVANFVRRADVAVTILDDYLYIVGGGVSVRAPKDKDSVEARVAGLNTTLALSLKKDWTSKDAEYDTIGADDFPTAIGHALWTNKDTKEVVFWGGLDFGSDRTGSRDPKVWTLAADGEGGGEWTSKDPPASVKRTAFGAYAECGGKGFFAGGYGDAATDSDEFQQRIAVPGLLTYDFKDGSFKNVSTEGLTSSGAFQKGSAVCVEVPNRKPKLFVMGGAQITPTDVADNNVDLQSFDNAYFYDLEKEKWFKQETQGSRPAARQGTCAVGAAGPNGTYEIFMYGGFRDGGGPMDDAWILSIPAFRWFQVDAKSDPRYSHACARHGSQMIVVGGNDNPVWNKKDPFPQGLGIFSLNTLAWEDGFEAESAKYQGPKAVRDWYDARGLDTIPWGSNEIKESFLSTDENEDTPTETPTSDPADPEEDSETSSTPAIAGGIVGGVLALAAFGAGLWFWRRRKASKEHEEIAEADESFAMKPGNVWTNVSEIDSTTRSELDSPAGERAAEARWGTKPRAELQASGHHDAVELPA